MLSLNLCIRKDNLATVYCLTCKYYTRNHKFLNLGHRKENEKETKNVLTMEMRRDNRERETERKSLKRWHTHPFCMHGKRSRVCPSTQAGELWGGST